MGFSLGIVGLPNVGKSTIFNALTSAKAAAANFPFCTIEPNTGAVPVPDTRLDVLSRFNNSEKIIPNQVTFVDIAGLIRGASKGEGLGNQFLGHIRAVDAIAHVVRCFESDDIIHVEGSVDPVRDVGTIDTELALSDLDSVQKQLFKWEKNARSGDKDAKNRVVLLQDLEQHLNTGAPARSWGSYNFDEVAVELCSGLLTAKPVLFVANVSEDDLATPPDPSGSRPVDKLMAYAAEHGSKVLPISGKIEAEIAELPVGERKEYLEAAGLACSGLDSLTVAGFELLNLLTYFTAGPKETRAWTVEKGTKAPQAAGKIHSDFERGFIRAEVISYSDYVEAGSEAKCRDKGTLRTEGKEYVVQDGDVMHFRFSV